MNVNSNTSNSILTPEDHIRLRELRDKLRWLWYPPMEQEIRGWRRKAGINSGRAMKEFAVLSRIDKEQFFVYGDAFIRLIEEKSRLWYSANYSVLSEPVDSPEIDPALKNEKDIKELRKKYHKLILKTHPDRGGKPEDFIRALNAYRKINESVCSKI